MSYAVYFKYGGKKYKLPVNPEEIKRKRELEVETYQILGSGKVSVPSGYGLEEYSFEAEFPSTKYHYLESGSRADADYYEKMFRKAQKNQKPIRFIASNGITDDISTMVLVKSVEAVEKAGEEGDKYLTLNLMEYKAAGKRYVAVAEPTSTDAVKQEDTSSDSAQIENPTVTENKVHVVQAGETLWSIAKKYYGSGESYTKIMENNPEIKNPNMIRNGDAFVMVS